MFVLMFVCLSVSVCVCVCVCERERERLQPVNVLGPVLVTSLFGRILVARKVN